MKAWSGFGFGFGVEVGVGVGRTVMKASSAKVPSSSKKWLTGHCFWLPSAEVATTVLVGIGRNLGALARPSEPLGRGVMPRVYLVRCRCRGSVVLRVRLV